MYHSVFRARAPLPRDGAGERLEAAIANAGYRCVECGSGLVTLDGDTPVIHHWLVDGGIRWCPCTAGGIAAVRCSIDLLDALAAAVALADYGEVVWHRRERVTT